jgi:hypothetical protein
MTVTGIELSDEALEEALRASVERAAALKADIAIKTKEMQEARSEAHLLEDLLSIRGAPGRKEQSDQPSSTGSPSAGASRRTASGSHPGVRQAVRELSEVGHPLHISELMARLKARDVRIPGAGKQANLIAHLTRSEEVVRPSRGMYALAVWDLPQSVKPATRRRVRGRSKAARS